MVSEEKIKIFDFDYLQDTLFVKLENNLYSHSLEKEGIIVDLDTTGQIMGFEILNFTNITGFNKDMLRTILGGKITLETENNILRIKMFLSTNYRNKTQESNYFLEKLGFDELSNYSISAEM